VSLCSGHRLRPPPPYHGSRFLKYTRFPTADAAEAVAAVLRADDDDYTYTVAPEADGYTIAVADEVGIALGNL
jgi:hypothetical protein